MKYLALAIKRVLERILPVEFNRRGARVAYQNEYKESSASASARWSKLKNRQDLVLFVFTHLHESHSQLQQDLLAIYFKSIGQSIDAPDKFSSGFFVEFGATDGVTLSNSVVLERRFGWNGIVCEPGKYWKRTLQKNRKCIIDTRCVYNKSGQTLKFRQTEIPSLSTIKEFIASDLHVNSRSRGSEYQVKSVSLDDLLMENKAPNVIDYLSIDTEGSELEILEAFDFQAWRIRFISVEHNYSHNREKLFDLLTKNGYVRVLVEISEFDDWYIHPDLCPFK